MFSFTLSITLSPRQTTAYERTRMAPYCGGFPMSQQPSKWEWAHYHLGELDILMGLWVRVSGEFVFKSMLCQILIESPAPPWLVTLSPPVFLRSDLWPFINLLQIHWHPSRCWRCITATCQHDFLHAQFQNHDWKLIISKQWKKFWLRLRHNISILHDGIIEEILYLFFQIIEDFEQIFTKPFNRRIHDWSAWIFDCKCMVIGGDFCLAKSWWSISWWELEQINHLLKKNSSFRKCIGNNWIHLSSGSITVGAFFFGWHFILVWVIKKKNSNKSGFLLFERLFIIIWILLCELWMSISPVMRTNCLSDMWAIILATLQLLLCWVGPKHRLRNLYTSVTISNRRWPMDIMNF